MGRPSCRVPRTRGFPGGEHTGSNAKDVRGLRRFGALESDGRRKQPPMSRSHTQVPPLVKDLMTRPVATVTPSTHIREALEMLDRHNIRHLPVLEQDRLVGFVTEGDLRETLSFQSEDWQLKERLDWAIFRVMNEEVIQLSPELPVADAIDLFLSSKATALPVIQPPEGKLIGILSTVDILHAARVWLR